MGALPQPDVFQQYSATRHEWKYRSWPEGRRLFAERRSLVQIVGDIEGRYGGSECANQPHFLRVALAQCGTCAVLLVLAITGQPPVQRRARDSQRLSGLPHTAIGGHHRC